MNKPMAQVLALQDAERSMREPASGSDPAGVVTIEVEDLLVTGLKLSKQNWIDEQAEDDGVSPSQQLAAALAAAYVDVSDAMRVRYFERIEEHRQRAQQGGSSGVPSSPDADRTAGEAASAFGEPGGPRTLTVPDPAAVDRVAEQLARDFARLDALQAQLPPDQPREPEAPSEVVGTSANGHVRLVFVVADGDDTLTEVRADDEWLRKRSFVQLAESLREAFNDAVALIQNVPSTPNPYQQMAEQFGRTARAAEQLNRSANLR